MSQQAYDIAVVGAGAAGLMASIVARRTAPEARIAAFDGAKKLGAKILIAGGGRCNVTHDVVHAADFNGSRNAIAKVLRTFTVAQTVEFFRELGVTLKREETGKLFPTTDRARTVLDALLGACDGVDLLTDHKVTAVANGFTIDTNRGKYASRFLILATGGRSVPKTGSDGSGYELARMLGHSVTETFPALVPLVVEHWLTELSGTSVIAELSVRASSGRVLHRDRGSMLFTHFGLSGPLVLDISRHFIAARRDDPAVTLVASFLPDESFDSLESFFLGESNPRATVASVLRGRIPERLLERISPAKPLAQLTRDERRRAIRQLIEMPIAVKGDRGFDFAEVTAGGVPLSEIDVATMESRRTPGLFLCGEILDVDGRIGGYNFQWAWCSGRLAGLHAARQVTNP